MKIRNLFLTLAILFAASAGASAQGLHYTGHVTGQQGVAASYAMVAVCPAGTTGPPYPCTDPVSVYSNEALTTAAPNPMRSDSEARFDFWVASGHYVLEEYGALQPPRYEDIYVYNGAGTSGGTVTSVNISLPNGFTVTGGPITGSGTISATYTAQPCATDQFVNGLNSSLVPTCAQPSYSALSGLPSGTSNTIAKFTGTNSIGNSSITDDGTDPPRSPNGLDTATGPIEQEFTAATGGVTAGQAVCVTSTNDSNGRPEVAPCGTSSLGAGFAGIAHSTVAAGSTVEVCWTTNCPALFDGAATQLDEAIISTTTAGDLHDTGAQTATSGQPNFSILSANTGAGTTALIGITDATALNPKGGGGGGSGTVVQVNGAATKANANLQDSTTVHFTTTTSGNTTNVNAAVQSAPQLSSTPTLCTSTQAARGVLANGDATGCFTPSGGSGGIGGGDANSPGSTDHVVNVINYGAVDEGGSVYDAALASFGTEWGTTTTSTAVASPGGTTVFANEVDLSVVTWGYTNFSSGPSGSGITQRVNLAAGTGCCYGLWMGTQTIATAGAITTTTGTLSASEPWEATEIPLIPKSGQTISVVGVSTAQPGNASTITINVPTGTVAGDAMLACFATGYDGTNIFKTYAGWSPVVDIHNGANSGSDLDCTTKIASGSEPASYTFSTTSGYLYPSGAIITLSNVAAIQTPITSATGAFTSAMTGDPSCISVSDPGGMNQACGPVFYGSSTTAYPLYGNPSSTAISAANFRWAHDDTSAFDAAITAISSTGGELYIPAGTYGITAPLTLLPCCKTVDIVGAGDAVTENVMGVTGNTFTPQAPSGSSLLILTNNMGGGAIQIQGTVDANGDSWSFAAQDILENFSMWAGAGTSRNGGEAPGYMVCPSQYVGNLGFCSGDGIDIGLSHVTIDHVAIGNFAGNGISVSADPSHYTWLVTVRNSRITLSGKNGIAVTGGYYTGDTHSSIDNHTDRIAGNDIWSNGGCGIFEGQYSGASSGVHILNVDIHSNDIEWNNQGGANPGAEVCLGVNSTNTQSTSMGGVISDNLFETSQANTNNVNIGKEFEQPGLVFQGNSFWFDPGTDAAPIYLNGPTSIVLQGNFTSLNYAANPDNSWFSGPGSLSNATVDNTNTNLTTPSFGTTITGTSGTAACSINDQGGNLRASCFLNGYTQTGTAQTWTFPIPFVTAPIVLETGGSCGTYNPTSTATVLTLPANASMTAETCQVMVMGQD